MKCPQCGAMIDPLALVCPYCRFTTPAGVAAKQRADMEAQQRSAWDAQAQHQARMRDQLQLERASTHSLLWSIAGVVLCCFPVGIVGIVMGNRARALARKLDTPPPGRATTGFVLGIISCVMSVAFLIFAFVQSHIQQGEAEERMAHLEQTAGKKAAAPLLDRDTACGLAELYALKNGYQQDRGYALEGFECVGKLDLRGDRAQVDEFRFKSRNNSQRHYTVSVCLKRGGQWYVSELREGGGCFVTK